MEAAAEQFGKVALAGKAAGIGNVRNGRIPVFQKGAAHGKAVLIDVIHRRGTHVGLEYGGTFTAGYFSGGSDFVQGDFFSVMASDEVGHVLKHGSVGRRGKGDGLFLYWEQGAETIQEKVEEGNDLQAAQRIPVLACLFNVLHEGRNLPGPFLRGRNVQKIGPAAV